MITVCDEWLNSVNNFHIDMGDIPQGLTLDRINNSKGYSKENCRWTTYKTQNNNTRRNKYITFNNQTLTHSQWSEKLGGGTALVRNRIKNGWSEEDAVTITPKR